MKKIIIITIMLLFSVIGFNQVPLTDSMTKEHLNKKGVFTISRQDTQSFSVIQPANSYLHSIIIESTASGSIAVEFYGTEVYDLNYVAGNVQTIMVKKKKATDESVDVSFGSAFNMTVKATLVLIQY
jgi:hypothetical protein